MAFRLSVVSSRSSKSLSLSKFDEQDSKDCPSSTSSFFTGLMEDSEIPLNCGEGTGTSSPSITVEFEIVLLAFVGDLTSDFEEFVSVGIDRFALLLLLARCRGDDM